MNGEIYQWEMLWGKSQFLENCTRTHWKSMLTNLHLQELKDYIPTEYHSFYDSLESA